MATITEQRVQITRFVTIKDNNGETQYYRIDYNESSFPTGWMHIQTGGEAHGTYHDARHPATELEILVECLADADKPHN